MVGEYKDGVFEKHPVSFFSPTYTMVGAKRLSNCISWAYPE